MFSFLNLSFDFGSDTGSGEDTGRSSTKGISKTDNNNSADSDASKQKQQHQWPWESGFSSPMTSTATLTPRTEPFFTPPPKKQPQASPEAREAEVCPAEGVKKRQSVRSGSKRRSSVFFRLPKREDPRHAAGAVGDWALTSKLSRPGGSSRRRSRRASVAPGGTSPSRTRADRAERSAPVTETAVAASHERKVAESSRKPDAGRLTIGPGAAAAAAAAGEPIQPKRSHRRETLLVTVGEDGPAPDGDAGAAAGGFRGEGLLQSRQSPRSSPRALSAGHRRESCRDSRVISRAPKGLSAARLLEDAHDVARIRSQANLRAKMEGVCWIASNWRVGDRKGVLSGKRFLVLCDNIVWAELREADRRCSVGEDSGGARRKSSSGARQPAAGFMPIIALDGAIVQHCEVATSNNGWVIEVVNPAEDVTLWLDPETPTALLRWGSVLCQALQSTDEEVDFDE